MRFKHHISMRFDASMRDALAALDVDVVVAPLPPGGGAIMAFDVIEPSNEWRAVRRSLEHVDHLDMLSTMFEPEEIEGAEWLVLHGDWHNGYPVEPKRGDWFDSVYDTRARCPACGAGWFQLAPFRIRGEPKWGRRRMFQLNWVFDEIFVEPALWREVFEPAGLTCRPVLSARGVQLQNVVQLAVDERVDTREPSSRSETCTDCGTIKYEPVTRGMYPGIVGVPKGPIVKTRTLFGSGAEARNPIYVRKDLADELRARRIRGAVLEPTEPPRLPARSERH